MNISQYEGTEEWHLDQTLYHLYFKVNQIMEQYKLYRHFSQPVDTKESALVRHLVMMMGIINTKAFLEEYNKHLQSKNPDIREAITSFKAICGPALDTIKMWTGMNDMRNEVLTHALRKSKDRSVSSLRSLTEYDIPNYRSDFTVMMECYGIIAHVLKGFQYRIDRYGEYVFKDMKPQLPAKFKDRDAVIGHLDTTLESTNKLIAEHKDKYGIPYVLPPTPEDWNDEDVAPA